MSGYVYLKSEPGLYTVGHYGPSGVFIPESDHSTAEEAAKRVAWLNGGGESRVTVNCPRRSGLAHP